MTAGATREAAPIGIVQLVDTLAVGGLERFARDLANLLPRNHFAPHLCTTRATGPLASGLAEDVETLNLGRRYRYDLLAFWRLGRWIRRQDVRVVHAHGHAVHAALVATVGNRRAGVVWHLHSGAWATKSEPGRALRRAARHVRHVFTVTEALAAWCQDSLGVPADRVEYLPNFITPNPGTPESLPLGTDEARAQVDLDLPGEAGKRLISVANLRPEKDLPNLIEAMRLARLEDERLHLLQVGDGTPEARADLARSIRAAGLEQHVSVLGHRDDVPALLRASDAAVLASRSEGFPLVLLEYGVAGLPTIATEVGQCGEVLDQGNAGLLVAPGDSAALARAMLRAVAPEHRQLGETLRRRVHAHYAAHSIVERITSRYRHLAAVVTT